MSARIISAEDRKALVDALGETKVAELLGEAQVVARNVVVVQNTGEDAKKWGVASLMKLTGKGLLPGSGVRKEDLRYVAQRFLEIADQVDPIVVEVVTAEVIETVES